MDIFLNDEPLEYQFEGERTFYDVIHAIEEEIAVSNAQIVSVLVNNKAIAYSEELWKQMPLTDIQSIHVEADTDDVKTIKLLKTILHYVDIIEHAMAHGGQQLSEEITSEELHYIFDHIDALCNRYSAHDKPLRSLLQYACVAAGILQSEEDVHIDLARVVLQHIRTVLSLRILLLLHPDNYWVKINTLIQQTIPQWTKIVEYLYKSQEHIAVQHLMNCVFLLIEWLHVLHEPPVTVTEEEQRMQWKDTHGKYNEELQDFFQELHQAIEMKDWITVSDLIEYEIVPKTQEYITIVARHYPEDTTDV